VQSQQTRWNSYFISIGRALNVKERIQIFCDQYEPPPGQKDLSEDRLSQQHWLELEHLHDQLETFYGDTLMTEGRHATVADHFSDSRLPRSTATKIILVLVVWAGLPSARLTRRYHHLDYFTAACGRVLSLFFLHPTTSSQSSCLCQDGHIEEHCDEYEEQYDGNEEHFDGHEEQYESQRLPD